MRKVTVVKVLFTVIPLIIFVLISSYLVRQLFIPQNENVSAGDDVRGDSIQSCNILEKQVEEELSVLSLPRQWYVRSSLVPDQNVTLFVPITDENLTISYSIDDKSFKSQKRDAGWIVDIPVADMEVGEKHLTVYADYCDQRVFKNFTFIISEPVYVVWSIDWEGFDVKKEYLKQMEDISKKYSAPMTHFFNPYIYVYLQPERAKYLTDWVKVRKSNYSESIGLHLHMYSKMVTAAGVKPDDTVAWGSPTGNGHDTPNSNYGYDDYKKILLWAINQYKKNDLTTPTMYRAGGWFIDEENIQVLNDLGFTIEASGRTYYIHGRNHLEGHWKLNQTTQPYRLNGADQNLVNLPNLDIWEFPNNGGDSWAYTGKQLTEKFESNYKGGVAKSKKVVTYISHPHWFDKEGVNINTAFANIKKYNYSTDSGPVLYVTLDKIYNEIIQL